MLYMVIEQFRDLILLAERFRQHGRMIPDGVIYHGSWVDPAALRCFQVMSAADRSLLDQWIDNWRDIVDFEVVPVVTSADFWAGPTRAR